MALKKGDLVGTVTDLISIDEFEPKTGTNNELVVVAFYVVDEAPAKDLDSYLERSFIDIIDVEVSPNPNDDGYYLVFVEMKRNEDFIPTLYTIIKDVERIAGKQDWKISPYLSDKMYKVTDKRWEQYVILNPAKYVSKKDYEKQSKMDAMKESVYSYFTNSGLSGFNMNDNNLQFKTRSGIVEAKLVAFCTTKTLVEKFDMAGTPVLWTKTSTEKSILSEALGSGWNVEHHGDDLLITNNWSPLVARIKVSCY